MKSIRLNYLLKKVRGLLPLMLGLALPLGASGATLVYFPFDEGEGDRVTDTASGLVGSLGFPQDPATDEPMLTDLSPSGEAGDRSVLIQGNGFLATRDTNNVLAFPVDQPFTVESWVFLDPEPDPAFLNANEGIVTYGNSYKLGLRSSILTFTLFGKVDISDPNLFVFATGWNHVAAAFEPGVGVTFYINGIPTFVADSNTVPPYLNDVLVIGAERLDNNILGNLDRVRIHEGLLTESEIDSDPANPKPVYENTIVAYDFNEAQLPAENAKEPALPTISSVEIVPLLTGPAWSEDDPDNQPENFSLVFDGTSRVFVPDTNLVIHSAITDYTLEAWVKLAELPIARAIMIEYRGTPGFSFSIDTDGTLHTTTFGKRDIGSEALVPQDGQWHHVAVVHQNGVEMRFYVDEILLDTVPYDLGPGSQSLPRLTIGMANSGANVFEGSLDRIRISDAALTPEEFDAEIPEGAPAIIAHPESILANAGESVTFDAEFTAGVPNTLQWVFRPFDEAEATPISGAVQGSLTLESVQTSDQGFYSLVVSNEAGVAFTTEAKLILPSEPDVLEQIWFLAPGDRDYLTPGDPEDAQRNNTERGMAYNPTTDHLLIVARETSPILRGIFIVDAQTGAHVGELDATGIEGGTFVLSKIGVADDGAIYAANFGSYSDTGTQTTIYRWEDESAAPTIAFQGNPSPGLGNQQWGKNLAVRGSGVDTQILMETRRQIVSIFTTTNGVDFVSNPLPVELAADPFSLGVAFGEGDTFWGKALNGPLYHMSFDLAAGTVTEINAYPEARDELGGISVNADATLLAGIGFEEGPDSVNLYDISDPATARLLDVERIESDNPNSNEAGNTAFGAENTVYALITNNGLVAYRINREVDDRPELEVTESGDQIVISWPVAAGDFVLEAATELGPDADWTTVTHETAAGVNSYTTDATGEARFFRLRGN